MGNEREKIFETWTNPSLIKLWFAPDNMVVTEVIIHLKVGGRYKIAMRENDGCYHSINGVYNEIQKPSLIMYSWSREESDQKESKVSLQLLDTLDGTEIRLIHNQFESTEALDQHAIEWEKCMDKLQAVL